MGDHAPFWEVKAREISSWIDQNCARRNLGAAAAESGLVDLLRLQLKRGQTNPQMRPLAWRHIVLELEASRAGAGDFHKLWVEKVTFVASSPRSVIGSASGSPRSEEAAHEAARLPEAAEEARPASTMERRRPRTPPPLNTITTTTSMDSLADLSSASESMLKLPDLKLDVSDWLPTSARGEEVGSRSDRGGSRNNVLRRSMDLGDTARGSPKAKARAALPQRPMTADSTTRSSHAALSPPLVVRLDEFQHQQQQQQQQKTLVEMSLLERQAHCQEQRQSKIALQRQLSVEKELMEMQAHPKINPPRPALHRQVSADRKSLQDAKEAKKPGKSRRTLAAFFRETLAAEGDAASSAATTTGANNKKDEETQATATHSSNNNNDNDNDNNNNNNNNNNNTTTARPKLRKRSSSKRLVSSKKAFTDPGLLVESGRPVAEKSELEKFIAEVRGATAAASERQRAAEDALTAEAQAAALAAASAAAYLEGMRAGEVAAEVAARGPPKKLTFDPVVEEKGRASFRLQHADGVPPTSIYRKRGRKDGVTLVVATGPDGKPIILRVLFDLADFDEDKAHYYLRDHHPDIYRPPLQDEAPQPVSD